MPIFEYVCADCQESFEKIVDKKESVVCPVCKSERLEKQYSSFGMRTSSGGNGGYPSLPLYNSGGGCGCGAGGCGCSCKN